MRDPFKPLTHWEHEMCNNVIKKLTMVTRFWNEPDSDKEFFPKSPKIIFYLIRDMFVLIKYLIDFIRFDEKYFPDFGENIGGEEELKMEMKNKLVGRGQDTLNTLIGGIERMGMYPDVYTSLSDFFPYPNEDEEVD